MAEQIRLRIYTVMIYNKLQRYIILLSNGVAKNHLVAVFCFFWFAGNGPFPVIPAKFDISKEVASQVVPTWKRFGAEGILLNPEPKQPGRPSSEFGPTSLTKPPTFIFKRWVKFSKGNPCLAGKIGDRSSAH